MTSTCSIHLALWPKLADALFYANFNQERFAWNHCRSCCTWFYFLINSSTLCFDLSPSHLYSLKLEYVLLTFHNSDQFIIFCPFRIAILVYAAPISINIHDTYKTISSLLGRALSILSAPSKEPGSYSWAPCQVHPSSLRRGHLPIRGETSDVRGCCTGGG